LLGLGVKLMPHILKRMVGREFHRTGSPKDARSPAEPRPRLEGREIRMATSRHRGRLINRMREASCRAQRRTAAKETPRADLLRGDAHTEYESRAVLYPDFRPRDHRV
jgi:hypothetical protein